MKNYFGTDGIRGRVGIYPINKKFFFLLGKAVGKFIKNYSLESKKILSGQDTRYSCHILKTSFFSGIIHQGINVLDVGIAPSPVVSYLVSFSGSDLGVVFTASHNSSLDNGIKFFSRNGSKISLSAQEIICTYVNQIDFDPVAKSFGTLVNARYMIKNYIQYCLFRFSHLRNRQYSKNIVLDCAQGAFYKYAPVIFNDLGFNVIKLSCEPDGYNINKNCGTLNPEKISKLIVEKKADLGFVFDGDGDRIVAVDEYGEVFDGDDILYVLSKFSNILGSSGIVGNILTNYSLERSLKSRGIPFIRSKYVGDIHIYELLVQKQWKIGGEPSCHIINLDYIFSSDALITSLQILTCLQKENKNLSYFRKNKNYQSTTNIKYGEDYSKDLSIFSNHVKFVQSHLETYERVILRLSGTEPKIRILVETEEKHRSCYWSSYLTRVVKQRILKGDKMQKIIMGNWKMNGSFPKINKLISLYNINSPDFKNTLVNIFLPFPYIHYARNRLDRSILLGGQNVSENLSGSYTGEVSAQMLKEVGCDYVLIGHSERRRFQNEMNKQIANKALNVINQGMIPVVCVGETLEQREFKEAVRIVDDQISIVYETVGRDKFQSLIVAYEPIWCIGTGISASCEQIEEIHLAIKDILLNKGIKSPKILYGGSLNVSNIVHILSLENVHGGLIGNASLSPKDFLEIISSVENI